MDGGYLGTYGGLGSIDAPQIADLQVIPISIHVVIAWQAAKSDWSSNSFTVIVYDLSSRINLVKNVCLMFCMTKYAVRLWQNLSANHKVDVACALHGEMLQLNYFRKSAPGWLTDGKCSCAHF